MAQRTPKAPKEPAKHEKEAIKRLVKKRPPGEACQLCGHWSSATEYGVDEKSGYCDRWEKLTARDFWCEEFVSRERFKQVQDQIAEDNEEFLDEET